MSLKLPHPIPLCRVKMLNVFEPCTLQLGDRNYYSSKEGDVIMTRDQWRKLMAAQLSADHTNPCPLRPRPPKNKTSTNAQQLFLVVHREAVSLPLFLVLYILHQYIYFCHIFALWYNDLLIIY